MLHLNFTPFPELTTKRLRLRALDTKDAEVISQLRSNEEVNQFLNRPPHVELKEANSFIEKIQCGLRDNRWVYWAICMKAKEDLIGTICYWNIVPERDQAETGYELLPEFQGKGIMEEAFKKVLEFGLRSMKLKTIVAITHPANKRSIRLLEKNHFLLDSQRSFITEEDSQDESPYYLYLPF